jgi:hypothetical protein
MDALDPDEAHRMYVHRLDDLGVMTVRRMLADAAGDSTGVACLCFEHDAADCHRSWFAQWWSERTGESVAELARPRAPRRPQLRLPV